MDLLTPLEQAPAYDTEEVALLVTIQCESRTYPTIRAGIFPLQFIGGSHQDRRAWDSYSSCDTTTAPRSYDETFRKSH